MNNLYKLLAFLCLVFVTSSLSAQTRPAFVDAQGLITLDASVTTVAPEYVADISKLHLKDLQEAQFYFQKYISKSSTRGMEFLFDFINQKMIIRIDMNNQGIIPLSHAGVTVHQFNDYLKAVHLGLI
jgi:hypothetical protein